MNRQYLQDYARLIVNVGVSVSPDQIVVITAPVETHEFVEMIAEAAYAAGAREVVPNWLDERLARLTYTHASEAALDEVPEYRKLFYLENVRKDACYIRLSGGDPDALKGVDQSRIKRANRALNEAIKEYRERMMANRNKWCVASAPTRAWAMKVFPDLAPEEAMEKLWDAIFKTNRIDGGDPVAAWEAHLAALNERMEFLNREHFTSLHYRSGLGTDLEIQLPENHLWLGGADEMASGDRIVANLPTEEVFTLPHREGVNGIVYASKPLIYNGVMIDEFWLRFEAGKVVDYDARVGREALETLLTFDEGASRLGEVALVPFHSPISQMGILFYNTLFDENASCHLALGEAYPVSIAGGTEMSREELNAQGANESMAHEDFMIGTEDLSVIGITATGKSVSIIERGDFVLGN